jgi:signal transduction histidine kinase
MTAALTRLPHVAAATVTLRDGTTAAAGERAHGRVALTAPIEARGTRLGTAELTLRRAPSLEQHAALAAVLVQAGVAAENRLLLERERERAVLQAELIMARHLAEEQRRGLAAALDRQERQRRDVAVELHEETAQALAAVLLQLRVLQRRDDHEPELEQLRSAVYDTVIELRRIATELRPPTLDQLGLGPALVNLAAAEQEARGAAVTVRTTDLDERLDGEHETAVFRIVEEAMHALSGPLSVVAGRDAHLLRIEVRARGQHRDGAVDARGLELLRARTELLGGAIETGADRVTVTLPAAA